MLELYKTLDCTLDTKQTDIFYAISANLEEVQALLGEKLNSFNSKS